VLELFYVESFRAKAFPIIKDLVVDRSALDRVVQAGGFISARTGSAPEANSILVPKKNADLIMEAAACIGCGACVAACPDASAMLFTGAKVSHLAFLPQPERHRRVLSMVRAMDAEGFGNCINIYEFVAVCPAGHQRERHGKDVSRIRGRGGRHFTRRRVRRFRARSPSFANRNITFEAKVRRVEHGRETPSASLRAEAAALSRSPSR